MVFNKVLSLYIVLIGFPCLAMEREKIKEEEAGKEKEPTIEQLYAGGSQIIDQFCSPVPSTPLSARRRKSTSLSLPSYNKLQLQPKTGSKRRFSLEVHQTESQFDLHQRNQSLFSELIPLAQQKPTVTVEILFGWILFVRSQGTGILDVHQTMQNLQETKFLIAKYFVDQLKECAWREGDSEHIKEAQEIEKKILQDEQIYYTTLYIDRTRSFKCDAELALRLFGKIAPEQRQQKLVLNCGYAFCKEASDYIKNAKKTNENIDETLDKEVNELAMEFISRLHSFSKDYDSFRAHCGKAGNIKGKAKQQMREVQKWEGKIKEKQKKIDTPRTRTAKFTLNSLVRNKDKQKVDDIIKKKQMALQSTKDQSQRAYLQSILTKFIEIKATKKREEYYKNIMEYKIDKLRLVCIDLLNNAEECLIRSSSEYIEAFRYNPQLAIIMALKDNIERVERSRAKKRNHNYMPMVQVQKFNIIQEKLDEMKKEVGATITSIYQEQD